MVIEKRNPSKWSLWQEEENLVLCLELLCKILISYQTHIYCEPPSCSLVFSTPWLKAHPGTKANTLGAVTDWNVDLHPESGIGINSIQIPIGADKPANDLKYIFFHRRSSCFTFGCWEVWTQANISDSCPSLRFELGDAAMTEGAHICNIHIDRCIIYTKYIYILQWLRMKYIDQAVWFSPHFGREKHGLTLLWKNNRASQRNNLAIIFFLTCKAGDTIRKITFLTILKSYAE